MKILLLLVIALWSMELPANAGVDVATTISPSRQQEIRYLLKQDCGSCHGLTLRGGLGPSLTADRLKPLPSSMLETTVLKGRTGTPMPPWENFLSEAEARWLVQQLQAGTALQEVKP